MSELPDTLPNWPTKEQYEAAWKGRERDLTKYYQDAAFAAIPRLCKLHKAATRFMASELARKNADYGCVDAIAEALLAVGEIPRE